MPRVYNVIKDFLGPGEGDGKGIDSISTSPYSLVAIWRYKYPATYSRKQRKSFSISPVEAVQLRDTMLLVVNDIVSLNIGASKPNTHSLDMTLLPGMNYVSEVLPGDVVAAWMFSDRASFDDVLDKLQTGKAANDFLSGLKFLGKVTAVQKQFNQSPDGRKSTRYLVTAHGFTELNGSIYYEPYLQSVDAGIGIDFLKNTGVAINELLKENQEGIDINKIIPVYLTAFYGQGIPKNYGYDNNELPLTNGLDNPNAFIMPGPVASLLGVTKASKPNGLFGFVDILEVLYGVQKYSDFSGNASLAMLGETPDTMAPGRLFSPVDPYPEDESSRQRYTGVPMIGTYLPSAMQFDGQRTVWNILENYLNPAVNEMYTCMKANAFGKIMPTFVVRQLPFSSGSLSEEYVKEQAGITEEISKKKTTPGSNTRTRTVIKKSKGVSTGQDGTPKVSEFEYKVQVTEKVNEAAPDEPTIDNRKVKLTRFLELPRWRIHPVLVRSYNVGRSDSLRFNWMYLDANPGVSEVDRTVVFTRNPPFADQLDIARNGMRLYNATVNCSPQDAIDSTPSDWMYILSDIVFGQHLTLTGSLETYGIQAPIVPGDNIEFDDAVFHIESLRHSFAVSPDGKKTFTTSISLTHGVRAKQMDGNDLSMYTGIKEEDLGGFDPAISAETEGFFSERHNTLPGNIEEEEERDRAEIRLKDAQAKLGQRKKGRTEKL